MTSAAALCAALMMSGIAAAADVAAIPSEAKPAPSKLDFLVLASMADTPQLMTMARYRAKPAPRAAKLSASARRLDAVSLAD